jgi:6-phosphogluconolactonase
MPDAPSQFVRHPHDPAVLTEIVRSPSVAALQESAAGLVVALAAQAVEKHGIFAIALSGGTTPQGVYARLADDELLRARVPWEHVRFFWGDERHVPPDHPDSNFHMVYESMLARLPVNPGHVWRIKGEYESAARAAEEYDRDLRRAFTRGAKRSRGAGAVSAIKPGRKLPRFDLVLLGMGADGHTASLFPDTSALHEENRLAVANWVATLNADRITLTPPLLNNAAEIVFLVTGGDKAEALKAVLEGPYEPDRLPAQLIRPTRGRLRWLVDPAASRLLSIGPRR